jgi:hypothetical protein
LNPFNGERATRFPWDKKGNGKVQDFSGANPFGLWLVQPSPSMRARKKNRKASFKVI